MIGGRHCTLALMSGGLFYELRRRVSGAQSNDEQGRRNRLDDQHLRIVLAAALSRDSTAIDVGAHQGNILAEILRIAPEGRHLAFEPLPEMAAGLRDSFPSVDVREVALAESAGKTSFVRAVDNPGYSGLRERDYPGETRLEEITVRTARLDDEVGDLRPSFIKIDVEGAELGVLKGAIRTLERTRPVVWLEHGRGAADHYGTTPEAVWDLLSEVGMRIYDADGFGPLSRDAMAERYAAARIWNYLAHM